jgi:hypothetical protein
MAINLAEGKIHIDASQIDLETFKNITTIHR